MNQPAPKSNLPASDPNSAVALASQPNGVRPSPLAWIRFFDNSLLIIAATALALALIFFVAYNWTAMGKMGKFALVQSALIVSVLGYVAFAYRRSTVSAQHKTYLIEPLLLLIASVVVGRLLALFGQIYQTGADSWQLFFYWALLITPWAVIARLPALWLLWLLLINISLKLSFADISFWFVDSWLGTGMDYQLFRGVYLMLMTAINSVALLMALSAAVNGFFGQKLLNTSMFNKLFFYKKANSKNSSQAASSASADANFQATALPWSVYLVGLLATYFATRLGLFVVLQQSFHLDMISIACLSLWLVFIGFFYAQFRRRRTDLFMLTCLSGSVIIVVLGLATRVLSQFMSTSALFILALLLIAMSAYAVSWLRNLHSQQPPNQQPPSEPLDTPGRVQQTHAKQLLANVPNDLATKLTPPTPTASKTPSSSQNTPWYLQLFLILSGLLAGGLISGFIVLLLNVALKDDIIKLTVGLLLLFVSFVLSRQELFIRRDLNTPSKQQAFSDSLAFALSLSGQAFLAVFLFEIIDDIALSIAAFMLMQALLLTLFTDVLSRFFSSVMGLLALVWLLAYVQLPEASPAILALLAVLFGVHLQSVKQPLKGRKTLSPSLLNAMAYATSFVLLLISVVFIAAEYQDGLIGIGSDFQYRYALAQLLLTLSSLYAAYIILQRYQLKSISKTGGLIALAIGLLAVVSVYVSGVLASSLVIIIAMANQNRTLRGLGISALVGYIFWYYYQLDSSLLLKAGSMLAVAAALFMIRWAMRRLVGIPKSTEHLTQSHLPSQADAKSLIYANVPTYANVRTYANVPTTTRAWGTNLAAAILGLLLTLSVVNISIAKNEKLLATGETVLLKLAPVDPRSLMQGDYMALNYALSEQIIRALEAQLAAKNPDQKGGSEVYNLSKNGWVIVKKDAQGIGHFVRLQDTTPTEANTLGPHELALYYRLRHGEVRLASNAFFFQEGHAKAFEKAEYGLFRVGPSGKLLLTDMADDTRQVITDSSIDPTEAN